MFQQRDKHDAGVLCEHYVVGHSKALVVALKNADIDWSGHRLEQGLNVLFYLDGLSGVVDCVNEGDLNSDKQQEDH
jgi:hypothetical protein